MAFKIDRNSNRISMEGSVHARGLRLLCTSLHEAIVKRGFSDIVLDFSICDGITEAVMLPMLPIIANYRKENVNFGLILSQSGELRRLFVNINWAHHINPEKYASSSHEGGHVPALQFENIENQGVILDRVMTMALSQLNTDRSTLKAIEWSLGEVMDNVSNHAQSTVGGFIQATIFIVTISNLSYQMLASEFRRA